MENFFLNKILSHIDYYIQSVARSCFEGAASELRTMITFINTKLENNEYFEFSNGIKFRPRTPVTTETELLTLMFDVFISDLSTIKDFPSRFENAHSEQFWMH